MSHSILFKKERSLFERILMKPDRVLWCQLFNLQNNQTNNYIYLLEFNTLQSLSIICYHSSSNDTEYTTFNIHTHAQNISINEPIPPQGHRESKQVSTPSDRYITGQECQLKAPVSHLQRPSKRYLTVYNEYSLP